MLFLKVHYRMRLEKPQLADWTRVDGSLRANKFDMPTCLRDELFSVAIGNLPVGCASLPRRRPEFENSRACYGSCPFPQPFILIKRYALPTEAY